MSSRRFACIGVICLIIAAVLAVGVVRGSSRDELRSTPQSGSEVVQPSHTPSPSDEATVAPSPTGEKHEAKQRHPVARHCVPTGLSVPKTHVDTQVWAVGTNSVGAQIVPSNPTVVSWWKKGVVPGQPGNAVFAGHTWSQGDGVFDRLSELVKGSTIKVRGRGCELTFRVDSIQRHVPANLSADKVASIYRSYGRPGVVLITCGDYAAGVYHSRIVVQARLIQM